MAPTSLTVLGSTGSVGCQTLSVVDKLNSQFASITGTAASSSRSDGVLASSAEASEGVAFKVVGLAAGKNVELLAKQVERHRPEFVSLADRSQLSELRNRIGSGTEIIDSDDALAELSTSADIVVNAVVGFAGLAPTLAALNAGKRLALANKESLVAAGPIVQQARKTHGAELIPVDSEPAAIFQCLQTARQGNADSPLVASLQLTASGGPFRTKSLDQLKDVTVAEALTHPTWQMGPKISVDSSTLMNKGLELIEINELFGLPAGRFGAGVKLDSIQVVVHPQSIVHSMVTFADGSVIAQMAEPNMELPIAQALSLQSDSENLGVTIVDNVVANLDWTKPFSLDFDKPDRKKFPCLDLAYEAARQAKSAPCWLNAANEVAVAGFIAETISWIDIVAVVSATMNAWDGQELDNHGAVIEADKKARHFANQAVNGLKT